jgi:hypothetical protein
MEEREGKRERARRVALETSSNLVTCGTRRAHTDADHDCQEH